MKFPLTSAVFDATDFPRLDTVFWSLLQFRPSLLVSSACFPLNDVDLLSYYFFLHTLLLEECSQIQALNCLELELLRAQSWPTLSLSDSCYLYTNGTQTCISSPHVLQTVIMEKKNTDTHIFISLLGITPVFKRHLELQKSKSIIGSSPSSLTFGLHVTYISGWPPPFSMISHKYPLRSHCAKNFSSFIPEIVESLFNVPSFSHCHPFISVLLSQPF